MGIQHTAPDEIVSDDERAWWKEAVVYQVYPRSFNDSDGDGIGDLAGITEKVDYLDSLGVDVVWLCPVYSSPQRDNGYDISDYRAIHEEYGTMADWETLLDALHDRDMRLIMDLVVNHTSDQHEWFQRSRRREGEYADYYHWQDGRPATEADYDTADGPADEVAPNNWDSIFGGSAWSYDDERGQWYLHLFDETQPDLNWRNPDVRAAVYEMMNWWLEKGIDGFRIDAIDFLSKAEGYPDGDPSASLVGLEQFSHGPRLQEYLRELHDETLANYDATTVGEMGETTVEQVNDYIGEDGPLDMAFQFDHTGVDFGSDGQWDLDDWGKWDLVELKGIIAHKQRAVEWDTLFFGNHDLPRVVSRFGDDGEYRTESAKLFATLLLTMSGTPYIYQGEEIGMTNAEFDSLDEVDDPMTLGKVEEFLDAGAIDAPEDALGIVNYWSRDHARTPMQWDDSENAGFTDGDPWLAVNPNYEEINVAAAEADPDSVLHYYRELVDLREGNDVLVYGTYTDLCPDHESVWAYRMELDEVAVLVTLNVSASVTSVTIDDAARSTALLVANYDDAPTVTDANLTLRPYEARVYSLN
ncbi:glycoside hydrolase family 13 protein [Haloarcula marina]|uniref:glycoside hydrolase family 13 protein n=1 Tax=Haloarcula marina TaxID=2961574 RepID=UPI0020B8CD7C|nr:alpha-glucosidase [Halomicroarcula marina]